MGRKEETPLIDFENESVVDVKAERAVYGPEVHLREVQRQVGRRWRENDAVL